MANPLRFFKTMTIIIALIVHEGETLECWRCVSPDPAGLGCGDPFMGTSTRDTGFIENCGKNTDLREVSLEETTHANNDSRLNVFCYKYTGKVLGSAVVLRGCLSASRTLTATSCMDWKTQLYPDTHGSQLNIETCEVCTSDLCNGAAGLIGTVVLFAPVLLLLTILT